MKEKREKTVHQSGRSMIEMLGVLAIVGVLSVGGLAGYNMAMRKIRIQRFIEELQYLVTDIRTLYPFQNAVREGKLSGFDLSPLEEAAGVFGTFQTAGVYRWEHKDGGATSIYIYIASLPSDVCREVAKIDWGKGTTITQSSGSTSTYYSKRTGTSEAIALCSKADPISLDLHIIDTNSFIQEEPESASPSA